MKDINLFLGHFVVGLVWASVFTLVAYLLGVFVFWEWWPDANYQKEAALWVLRAVFAFISILYWCIAYGEWAEEKETEETLQKLFEEDDVD